MQVSTIFSPRTLTKEDHTEEIKRWIRSAISSQVNIADALFEKFQTWYLRGSHDMKDLKKRSTSSKGLIFETFCKMYLESCGYEVWLLSECPSDILLYLDMRSSDIGIDIVARREGKYFAVQAKYRTRAQIVNWKELSTFFALASRLDKFTKHIVMTNCKGVNRKGTKTDKDQTIAIGTFRAISSEQWLKMIGSEGTILCPSEKRKTPDEIRALRLARFSS